MKIVMKSASKSCELDPIPTFLLKQSMDVVLPVLTDIVNASLTESTVPQYFRQVIVRPLLKKPDLDKEVFKNYRPVSKVQYQICRLCLRFSKR